MALKLIVTRDFEHMSAVAAEIAEKRLEALQTLKLETVLGLATGSSPTGLYRRLAKAANQGKLDSSRWRTFNLDEYIGLKGGPGDETPPHPASYRRFMLESFFRLLKAPPIETSIPPGHLIQSAELGLQLETHPDDWHTEGRISGKAIVIHESPESEFLNWIRTDVLHPYVAAITGSGGIDLQVLGIGGRGHVAFHEAGIPFDLPGLLLVDLDIVTQKHAVEDGKFPSLEECPRFALTMSVDLVFRAGSILVLANGPRKREAITASILETTSDRVPMSYAQVYADRGGDITFVLDREAAKDLVSAQELINARGFEFENRC